MALAKRGPTKRLSMKLLATPRQRDLAEDLIKFLSDVKQSLRTTQRIAKDWEMRPKFREAQPRWTYDDEAAYRGELLHSIHNTQAYLLEIQALLDRIESELDYITRLRQWLLDDLSLKEARISNRSADDVRIFTYATVVFLPLSFVSSIFSMSEAPSRATVQPFIIAAVVALVATILFLLNAGTPMRRIIIYKNKFLKLPQDDSINEHADSQWNAVFETFYSRLLISPARMVLTARDILAQRKKQRKQRKKVAIAKNRPKSAKSNQISDEEERKQLRRIEQPIRLEGKPERRQETREQRRNRLNEKLRRRQETTQLAFGFILLPLFFLSMLLRFIGQNVFDLARFLLITLPHYQGRRIKQEIAELDDDHGSIRSHIKPSANEMKNTNNNETISEQQEIREDQKKILRQFHDDNLKRFIQTPRFDDVGRYLQQGRSWDEAHKEMKHKREKDNADFKSTTRSYKHVRRNIIRRAEKAHGKIADVDLGMDLSSDDSSKGGEGHGEGGEGHSDGYGARRFGFSMRADTVEQNRKSVTPRRLEPKILMAIWSGLVVRRKMKWSQSPCDRL